MPTRSINSANYIVVRLFEACLVDGVFPKRWKCQRLVLLPKADEPIISVNHLPTDQYVYQKQCRKRWCEYCRTALSDQQFGFCTAESTVEPGIGYWFSDAWKEQHQLPVLPALSPGLPSSIQVEMLKSIWILNYSRTSTSFRFSNGTQKKHSMHDSQFYFQKFTKHHSYFQRDDARPLYCLES